MNPLIQVKNVTKQYTGKTALRGVSLDIFPGEVVGLVGESGSGKSTLGRVILGLDPATSGEVWFDGQNLANLMPTKMKLLRRQMQVVFQDPHASLNPRMTVLDLVAEGLDIHKLIARNQREARVTELLAQVGLGPECLHRFAHEFSGGQRQRICIARALAVQPRLLICDEPTSALDLSIQAQVLNLLQELQQAHQLTYLFIAHDLAVVRHIATRVAVMQAGKLVELADTTTLFTTPKTIYTRQLLNATHTLPALA